MLARIVVELSGYEAAAVVGDQRRHASGKSAVVRRLPGLLQRSATRREEQDEAGMMNSAGH